MKTARDLLAADGVKLCSYCEGEHRAACPKCAVDKLRPRDDALAVKIDDRGFQLTCHRCGWETFGFYTSKSKRTASRPIAPGPAAPSKNTETAKIDAARHIWREAAPIKRTIAETYLRSRGITCPMPNCLRFHRACWHSDLRRDMPAMIALMLDVVTNEPCGVHRTYLKPDGSGKITDGKAKKMLGRHKGAAIKLARDDDVLFGLGVAEGIETSLSLISNGFQVWALGSAGNIENFPVLSGIDALTIFADHDPAGIKAATACATRWSNAGVEARIAHPREEGRDWNDIGKVAA
jgi:putative DNA primase/helicase